MNRKKQIRLRRSKHTRMRIRELQEKNGDLVRIVINKSPRHIAAQVIVLDDAINRKMKVIVSASTMEKDIKSQCKYTGNVDAAKIVGKELAQRLQKAGSQYTSAIAFDRSGHKYHGRIKALADAAREAGLDF